MSNCSKCGKSTSEGHHKMSKAEAERYPHMACPKCSGDALPECVSDSVGYYRCTCGVGWTEPLASF